MLAGVPLAVTVGAVWVALAKASNSLPSKAIVLSAANVMANRQNSAPVTEKITWNGRLITPMALWASCQSRLRLRPTRMANRSFTSCGRWIRMPDTSARPYSTLTMPIR